MHIARLVGCLAGLGDLGLAAVRGGLTTRVWLR